MVQKKVSQNLLECMHLSSWLDATSRVLLADVGCLKAWDPSMCWEFIQQIATSTNQHLPAPTGSPGSLCSLRQIWSTGLRSALRFAGLLTQEATVPACPYSAYRYTFIFTVLMNWTFFRVFDSDQGCTMHKLHKHNELYHLFHIQGHPSALSDTRCSPEM